MTLSRGEPVGFRSFGYLYAFAWWRSVSLCTLVALVACGGGDSTGATEASPAVSALEFVAPVPSSAATGEARTVEVRARSAVGAYVVGAQISGVVLAGGGTITPGTAVTNPQGIAQFVWRIGGGTQEAQFRAVVGTASVPAFVLAPPTVPGQPSAANATTSSLVVSWSSVSASTRYELRRALNSTGPWTLLGGATSPVTQLGLSSSTTYWYQVRACNESGCSGWSLEGGGTTSLAPPLTPFPPTLGSATSASLTVTWNAVGGATFYELQRALGSAGPWTLLGQRTSPTVETGLSSSTTYWYQVRACNAAGCSGWSLAMSGTEGSLLGIGFGPEQFATVPAGSFEMGSNFGNSDERPLRGVTLTRAFQLQRTEVTQAQWRAVMGTNPSAFSGCDRCPVEQVSWDEVQLFITELNRQTGQSYRLPTEAEWEFAARAQAAGDPYGPLDQIAWYSANSSGRTHVVAQKRANNFGLYDMLGNVWEWVQDWYDASYYATGPSVDPPGPATGAYRVLRGFSYQYLSVNASFRYENTPSYRWSDFGFRLARTP
jgi:predicted secreted Zn-dependent protease